MALLDPRTANAPSAVATGGESTPHRIDVLFAIPDLPERNLWHRWWVEGQGWQPRGGWRQRGGSWDSAVVATAFSGGRVDAFGLGSDGALWHTWGIGDQRNTAGEWPRESLGTPRDRAIVSSPAAVALSPTVLLAAVRTRTRRDGAPGIWFASSDGPANARWRWRRTLAKGWPTARRNFATGLGMAWRKPGALDLLTVTNAYELQHTWRDGDTTSPWGGFGQAGPEGGLTSTPSATPWWNHNEPDFSSLHVVSCYGPFPAGPGVDPGRVELKSWLGRHWASQRAIYTSYSTDGRVVFSPPTVTSWGKPRLDVFFLSSANDIGSDPQITHGWSNNARDWEWELLGFPRLP